ncbi:YfhO family protein, partial [bacterium]|nr:YfhO family protein [bacterium]
MENKSKLIYGLSFILPILILTICLIPCHIFPFGQERFLWGDAEFQYINFLSYFKSIFTTNNDFFYSFSMLGGSPIFDFSAYYLHSPLNFILFLFPNEYLQIGLQIIIILRLGLCGLTFAYFLNKVFGYR